MITNLVDGGYLSWSYGSIGFKAWIPLKKNFTKRSGTLICLDSTTSERKKYDPNYKNHRKKKREERNWIHERVLVFQSQLREDPTVNIWEEEGLEADDLLAVLVPRFKYPVRALDKDLLQIPHISISKMDGSEVTIDTFASRHSKKIASTIQTREHILLTLVLMGDKSDDIPRLIPPRNLELFSHIMMGKDPWTQSYQLFGDQLLHNLYLAVLPGPWCFKKVPDEKEVFDKVRKGIWGKDVLRYSINNFIEQMENL